MKIRILSLLLCFVLAFSVYLVSVNTEAAADALQETNATENPAPRQTPPPTWPAGTKITVDYARGPYATNRYTKELTVGEPMGSFPEPIVPEGYVFTGWYTNWQNGSKVDENTIFTGLFPKVYAQFEFIHEVPFTDVTASQSYYKYVQMAHADGILNGKSDTIFAPDDSMTFAEAIKIASCMHQKYHEGKVTFANGSGENWYQPYVDYARANGIPCDAEDYNSPISRSEYVHIFYYAFPESNYAKANSNISIPDVKEDDMYAKEIYAFYHAGILTGHDEKATFLPASDIKRSEVATIIVRMMYDLERIVWHPVDYNPMPR